VGHTGAFAGAEADREPSPGPPRRAPECARPSAGSGGVERRL